MSPSCRTRRVARLSALAGALFAALPVALLVATASLEAQRPRTGTARVPRAEPRAEPPRGARAVRAEYANVLLQAGRYREAAGEFRRLLEGAPNDFALRLGLARALAWGGRPRDAEPELRALLARRPRDAGLDSLLRSVRESYDPSAREAAAWVAERPGHVPYRMALARALVRERRAGAALAHYDTLWTLEGAGPRRGELLREYADAHAAAGDRAAAVRFLQGVVAGAYGDTAARRALADAHVANRSPDLAIAQYDTLLQWQASAPLYLERGRLRAWRRDLDGAESDLRASLAIAPSVEAWVQLGDVERWRGDYGAARAAYASAAALRPGDRGVARALGDLRREERPPIAFAPMQTDDPGWQLAGESVEDNTGFSYFTSGVRRGFDALLGTVASMGVEYRSLGDRDGRGRFVQRINGYVADVGISRTFTYGRIGARGGLAMHDEVDAMPYGSASAMAWYGAWAVSGEVDAAPAYPSLLTMATLLPSDAGTGRPLVGRSATATVAGPIGAADLAVSAQRTRLDDDNLRTTLQGYARWGFAPHLHAVYSASVIRFAERSVAYWDPPSYVAHAAGLELASRRPRGVSFALRALPGIARAEEVLRDEELQEIGVRTRWVPQFSGGGELSYRTQRWELAAGLAYGRGRSGDYERLDSNVQLRLLR